MGRENRDKTKASWLKAALNWLREERGNITPLICLLLVPIIGAFAIGTETSGWFLAQRSMQHAADSAALAAATNGSKLSTDSTKPGTADTEAKAVATKYGYTNGGDVTVGVTMPSCPAPYTSGTCYQVTISRNIPIRLARIVGYNGDVAYGAGRAKTVTSTAIARLASKGTYCIQALGADPKKNKAAIIINGAPKMDLTGCDITSNGSATCNASVGIGNAYVVDAGDSKDCGVEHTGTGPTDIYAGLASKIAPDPCVSVASPQVVGSGGSPTIISSNKTYCGGLQLAGDMKISGDVILYIVDGDLDVKSFSLTADAGNHLTVIFTSKGTGAGASHIFKGGGLFDFAGPTTGDWAGVAIYTDSRMTGGTYEITNAGSAPTYNVTGLLYMPFSDVTISGAINHKTGGDNCMGMVVKTLTINGTGSIFSTPSSECDRAALTLAGAAGSSPIPLLIQ